MTREGLFDDRSCDEIHPFVCKIAGNATKSNEKCNNFNIGNVVYDFIHCIILARNIKKKTIP